MKKGDKIVTLPTMNCRIFIGYFAFESNNIIYVTFDREESLKENHLINNAIPLGKNIIDWRKSKFFK